MLHRRDVRLSRAPDPPSVGLIVGLGASSACALLLLGLQAFSGVSFLVGFALATLPVPLLVALVLMLDRLEPEPWRDLLLAFLWGAGVAALGAVVLNTAGYELVARPVFGEHGEAVSASIGAPLVEEVLKGAVLFGLLWFRREQLNGLTDGIIYAAMVGLGFAMMENIAYYIKAFDEDALLPVFIARGIASPFCHPLFTAMTGLGVAYAALRPGAVRLAAPVAGLVAAMLLHSAWNFAGEFGLPGLLIVYGVDLCVVAGLIAIIVHERRETVRLIRRYLPAYAGTGLITPQDVRMLADLDSRRRARQQARAVGGLPARRAMADYQLAATELALLHRRAGRGIRPHRFERRRQDLLDRMDLARRALQTGRPRGPWRDRPFSPGP